MKTPYLKQHYTDIVVPELTKSRGYANRHQVPRLVKIVLNTGFHSDAEKGTMTEIERELTAIAGQKALLTRARKSVANFKLRQGQFIGCSVTLRGPRMYDFLYRLVAIALPSIRDFRGVSPKLDGHGNYNLGITDMTVFPEVNVDTNRKHLGCDVTIVTTAETDDEGRELLRLLGMPFRRPEGQAAPPKSPAPDAAAA